jgi:hypothetical protein
MSLLYASILATSRWLQHDEHRKKSCCDDDKIDSVLAAVDEVLVE